MVQQTRHTKFQFYTILLELRDLLLSLASTRAILVWNRLSEQSVYAIWRDNKVHFQNAPHYHDLFARVYGHFYLRKYIFTPNMAVFFR